MQEFCWCSLGHPGAALSLELSCETRGPEQHATNKTRRTSTQGSATKVGGYTYAAPTLSFATDVKPILEAHCTVCHTQGGTASFTPFTDVAAGAPSYAKVHDGVSFFAPNPVLVTPGDPSKSFLVAKTAATGTMYVNCGTTTAERDTNAKLFSDWVLHGAKP